MIKRLFLFMAVNILIIVTISIILNLLGIRGYMTAYGIDYTALAVFCLIWGMVGAIISLFLSKFIAKMMLNVKVIDPNTTNPELRELLQTVSRLAQAAGIGMPEVGIYPSPEVNAFATGPTKNSALVAVSEGLVRRMNHAEIEGVLGHEIAHIANGDMVTMTLIQGIINAFVMFLSRVLAFFISNALSRDREGRSSPFLHIGLVIIFEILFGILGMIVVAYFSRIREYAADKGGARLAGTNKMIAALEALKRTYELVDNSHQSLATLKINGGKSKFLALFATHPSLDARIARLKNYL